VSAFEGKPTSTADVTGPWYCAPVATAKFLHAADLHLGAPLKSLGQAVSPAARERLLTLVNGAYTRMIEVAKSEKVDFVVLAGDIYDDAERDPGAQRRFLLGLRELVDAGIRVFMVHGNHDPLTRDIRNGLLPEGVVVFPAGKLGVETVTMSNGVEVTVAGVSYRKKEELETLVPLFAGVTGQTVVGVLHTNVGANTMHGPYAPTSPEELAAAPVHYWALGHIHLRSVNRNPRGWWAYPGNLQGRSVKAAECGPKGVLVVSVDDNGAVLEPEFRECSTVRFARLNVPMDDVAEEAAVGDAVNAVLADEVARADGTPLVVRLEFTGQTDIPALRDTTSSAWVSLSEAIVEEAADVLGDGVIAKIRSSCVPRIDLAHERTRPTLLGKVLLAVDEAEASSDVRQDAIEILVNALGATR
jgi:DNA repair exonuclease SbcCD nuclease subunit